MQAVAPIGQAARLHPHPEDVEGGVEQVQQAGVVGVLDVLKVEFPVGVGILAGAAEVFERLVEHPIDVGQHGRADIVDQGLDRVAEGGEDQAAIGLDAQGAQAMIRRLEVGRHALHRLQPAPKRHADQGPGRVIAPLVIDAFVRRGVAARLAADDGAAVGAAVDPGGQFAAFGPGHHHRSLADEAALEVEGIGNLGFQAQEVPGRAAIDPVLLQVVDLGRAEDRVGDARAVGSRETR